MKRVTFAILTCLCIASWSVLVPEKSALLADTDCHLYWVDTAYMYDNSNSAQTTGDDDLPSGVSSEGQCMSDSYTSAYYSAWNACYNAMGDIPDRQLRNRRGLHHVQYYLGGARRIQQVPQAITLRTTTAAISVWRELAMGLDRDIVEAVDPIEYAREGLQHLHAIASTVTKQERMARGRVKCLALAHQRCESVDRSPQVGGAGGQIDPNRRGDRQHGARRMCTTRRRVSTDTLAVTRT